VSAIAAGYQHTCALTSWGGAKYWGRNADGQLGSGSITSPRATPVNVVDLTSGVSAIAAGDSDTCALTRGGVAKCWGSNMFGQLGNPSPAPRDLARPLSCSGAGALSRDPHFESLEDPDVARRWARELAAGRVPT
jgi:alpha-tubulin suppressor-like RCC1 family protein